MQLLSTTVIAGAITQGQAGSVIKLNAQPRNLTIQANFAYGAAGTTVDAYVQTSLDNGATWTDIAEFHFTTATARKIVNLNAQTPQTTPIVPTNGTMTANTAQDGVLGPQFRVLLASTGTYTGATSLRIDVNGDQIPAMP